MDKIERFLRRKRVQEQRNSRHGLAIVVDSSLVDEFLSSEIDWDSVQRTEMELAAKYDFEFDVELSEEEIQRHFNIIEAEFDDERFRLLLSSCLHDVLSAVVSPFGLGGIVSLSDKNGGNVTTVHNAKDGVYGRERDKYSRKDYTSAKNSEGNTFEGSGKTSVGSTSSPALNSIWTRTLLTRTREELKGGLIRAPTTSCPMPNSIKMVASC